MDTADKYTGDEFYVVMAGETPPDHIVEARKRYHRERVADDDDPLAGPDEWTPSPASDEYRVGDNSVPVDGWVTLYDPEKLAAGEPFKHGTFPFRAAGRDDHGWFARPDAGKWRRMPVWKWQNPAADPHESLTLNPSIGRRDTDSGDITLHLYIRNGEIDWI